MISSCPPRIASFFEETSWLFFDFFQNLKNTHLFYSELFLKTWNQGFIEVENLQKTRGYNKIKEPPNTELYHRKRLCKLWAFAVAFSNQ
jgi:hypothetical protein